MDWFNCYGLAIIALILLPNIVYALLHREGFQNSYQNKTVQILEQLGRYGCMLFMVFNLPYTYFNFWFENALIAYLCGNGALLLAYLGGWVFFRKNEGKTRAVFLSILPALIFLYSGILLLNLPLLACSVLFGVNHIILSYKNAK